MKVGLNRPIFFILCYNLVGDNMQDSFSKIKIAMILNYIIFVFTVFASIVMFSGIKFMNGIEPVLESSALGMFRFFTVDSNILMGIVALIMAFKERKCLTTKSKTIPTIFYILKLVSTVAVTLTFIVVVLYLARISKGGMMSMLQNSNLFFHLIIPILSIITFCLFENTKKIKFIDILYCLLPISIYGIFYLINIFTHVENGIVSPKYDWYWFVQGGLHQVYIVLPIILFVTFVIIVILWIINKIFKI